MCPNESDWIRLAGGELSAARAEELRLHAQQCTACAQHCAEAQRVHDALGAWDVRAPQRDLSASVVAAAEQARPRVAWGWCMRAAAAVMVCAGVGWTAGRSVPGGEQAVAEVSEAQLFAALGMDAVVEQADLLGAIEWTVGERVREQ